jgi:hypothetical protein
MVKNLGGVVREGEMCRTTTGHLCWWMPVPLWREARDKLKLLAAGSTTITEVTLPPSCSCTPLLLLKDATSGSAAAAAGTASVTIPNYLLQDFSIFASGNPLSSSLSPSSSSSQFCSATLPTFSSASFLKNLSFRRNLQNPNSKMQFPQQYTQHSLQSKFLQQTSR